MENASKALIIAGGILLALMLLSILVYVAGSMQDWAGSQTRDELTKQIAEFNKGYEVYNKKRMYGTDVISVVNKANDDNIRNQDDEKYWVNVTVLDKDDKSISVDNSKEFKMTIFTCEEMKDSNGNGRIDSIVFRQI